jgi:hypothetical protein
MRLTSIGALALTGVFVIGACGAGTKTSPAASTTTGGAGASAVPTMAASYAASMAPASMGAESMPPASMGTESMAPASMGTESMAPGSTVPMSMSPESMAPGSPDASMSADDVMNPAANLRVDLNYLFGEHLMLAAKATGSALGGRTDEFNAYATLLNTNGTDIGAMIGHLYGTDAQDKFNTIWSAHNGFFVDYTTAVAQKDATAKQKAVDNLTNQYVPQFSQFLADATGLPLDAITNLVTEHVTTTAAVVDAQASGDWVAAYKAIRTAYAHMSMIGDALAPAIATKNNIASDPSTPGVDFRTALDQLLQEHLFLATFATDAALGGRTDEFSAAGDALNTNGTDIGAAIGKIYGQDAQDKFNEIWSAHNGYFVDYTEAVAAKDDTAKKKAVDDLTNQYVPQFADFLASATSLSKDDLTALISDHVGTTAAVVDAQGAGDEATAATADRTAAMHMRMIGDPLAAAIVAAMPNAFK